MEGKGILFELGNVLKNLYETSWLVGLFEVFWFGFVVFGFFPNLFSWLGNL